MKDGIKGRILPLIFVALVVAFNIKYSLSWGAFASYADIDAINGAIDKFEAHTSGKLAGYSLTMTSNTNYVQASNVPRAMSVQFQKTDDGYDYYLKALEEETPYKEMRLDGMLYYSSGGVTQYSDAGEYEDPRLLKQVRRRPDLSAAGRVEKTEDARGNTVYKIYASEQTRQTMTDGLSNANAYIEEDCSEYVIDGQGELVSVCRYIKEILPVNGEEVSVEVAVYVDSFTYTDGQDIPFDDVRPAEEE